MIKLHGFGPAFNLIEASPFVTKVILFMKMHNIAFTPVYDSTKLGAAPKKKFPYIEDDDQIIADSSSIIDYLSQKHEIDLDNSLSESESAYAYMLGKSLEENLYWCLVYSRWVNDDTWPAVREHFFQSLPFPLNKVIANIARKSTIKRLEGHGMGAHSAEEILEIAKRSFNSLSVLLADKDYFFGSSMSSFDIIAFAQLSSFTLSSLDNPSNRAAREHQNLVDFTRRVSARYLET